MIDLRVDSGVGSGQVTNTEGNITYSTSGRRGRPSAK